VAALSFLPVEEGYGSRSDSSAASSRSDVEPDVVTKAEPEFRVWLVLRETMPIKGTSFQHEHNVRPFDGGILPRSLRLRVRAIYATKAEARSAASAMSIGTSPDATPPGVRDTPIAYLVSFVLRMHASGESTYWAHEFCGGKLDFTDDRDVYAVFATAAEATEHALRLMTPTEPEPEPVADQTAAAD
jgi:hypothetical protein